MRPHLAELSEAADTLICAYPNAGLPNAFGQYDESPEIHAEQVEGFAREGLVNIVGGCCCGRRRSISRRLPRPWPSTKPREIRNAHR